jgi:hypothetical protein
MFQQPFRCQHLPRTNLGVGLRWPCRGQTCGGVLGPLIDQIFWIEFLNYSSTFKIPIATQFVSYSPITEISI